MKQFVPKTLFLISIALFFSTTYGFSQSYLTLDSCRALALRNNKQLAISAMHQKASLATRKSVRTKYLPKIDVVGGYNYFSKEISILSDKQHSSLQQLGTKMGAGLVNSFTKAFTEMVASGQMNPLIAQQINNVIGQMSGAFSEAGNSFGSFVSESFRTDTRNLWAGTVVLRQPIFLGGAIHAANKMADIAEGAAKDKFDLRKQDILYDIDKAYWTVISLRQKQQLANSYNELVQRLRADVHKMIDEGLATRADGLRVDVKKNEADMQVMQVENGLSLAKMQLCQLCGLSLDSDIVLADEQKEITGKLTLTSENEGDYKALRPELRLLRRARDLNKESERLILAENLPHILLTSAYTVSNPNMFNGFQRKFDGAWNIGVVVQMPIWNWFEGKYKLRAARAATTIADLELQEAEEKISLQLQQNRYQLTEANKRLTSAIHNLDSADENLRCATVGFKEGVIEISDVMAAQAAWQQAQSQKIDAEIDVRLSFIALQKALGTFAY